MKYVLIAIAVLVAIFILLWIRNIIASVRSGDFQKRLEEMQAEKDGGDNLKLSPEEANAFLNDYMAKQESLANAEISDTPDRPLFSGRMMSWIALPASNADEVVAALDVSDLAACNWESASTVLSSTTTDRAFASGAVDGWVFIFGLLPEPNRDQPEEGLWAFLEKLSERFGEAQYFSCSTVVSFYSWAKAENGKMVRAFSVSGGDGKIKWNHGEITPAEREAGVTFASGVVGSLENVDNVQDFLLVDMPQTVAQKWSLDPEKLWEREDLPASAGVLFTWQSLELKTEAGDPNEE